MWPDSTFGRHERWVRQHDVGVLVPVVGAGQRVVVVDVGVLVLRVQVHVGHGQLRHFGRDVVALQVVGQTSEVRNGQRGPATRQLMLALDVLISRHQETSSPAGRVNDDLVLLRVDDLHDEIDDVPRSAELASVGLRLGGLQQVLVGVAQLLAVVVHHPIHGAQEQRQRPVVAERHHSVLENLAEHGRHRVRLLQSAEASAVEFATLRVVQTQTHYLVPAIRLQITSKVVTLTAKALSPLVIVAHELVRQRQRDLLALHHRDRNLADQRVAGVVDDLPGVVTQHVHYLSRDATRPRSSDF